MVGMSSILHGVRIEQVAPGFKPHPLGPSVTDVQGVHDPAKNTVYVTAKNYDAIKASARIMGQPTYERTS